MTTAESDKSQKTPRAVAKNSFDEGERKAVGKALAAINKVNLFYTVLIFFNNFAFGISVNLIGATLVDIGFVYGVSLDVISQLLIANNVGYMFGALAGYLYLWLNRQLMLTIFSALIAVTSLLIPHYGYLAITFVALTVNGLGGGAWDSSNTAWLVDMWPRGNGPVLQANQFLYGVGTTASPLLASSFIFGEAEFTQVGNRTLTKQLRREYLSIPFAINGVIQMVAPTLFFILFFTKRYTNQKSSSTSTSVESLGKEINSTSECQAEDCSNIDYPSMQESLSYRSIPHRKIKLVLCGLCIAASFTAETGYFPYCTAMFQYLEIKLTAPQSARVTSVLSLTYTIGPLITAFISLKLKPDIILTYHYATMLGGVAMLYFGRFNLKLIYIGSAILGYGFSAMTPALYSFAQRHFGIDNRVCACYTFLSGSISLVIPLVMSQSFKSHPHMLLYLLAAFITTSTVLYTVIRVWIWLSKRRRYRYDFNHGYDNDNFDKRSQSVVY